MIILRSEVMGDIGNICYLLGRRETDRPPAVRALMADVVDDGNRELAERAVDRGFAHAAHYVNRRIGAATATATTVDGGADRRYSVDIAPGGRWDSQALQRLEHDLFAYLVECGLCSWLAIVWPERLNFHTERRERALQSLRELVSGSSSGARIRPHPF